jgi:hypothetical protein
MKPIGQFTITQSLVIPGRGRCIVGDLEGSAEIGGRITIEIDGEKKDMEIATVEMGNNPQGDFFVMLGFIYNDEEQKKASEFMTVEKQVVQILGEENSG